MKLALLIQALSEKAWIYLAGAAGASVSVFLTNKQITFWRATAMILTGQAFATFIAPLVAELLHWENSSQRLSALAFFFGLTGINVCRALIKWVDGYGLQLITRLFSKLFGEPKNDNNE